MLNYTVLADGVTPFAYDNDTDSAPPGSVNVTEAAFYALYDDLQAARVAAWTSGQAKLIALGLTALEVEVLCWPIPETVV